MVKAYLDWCCECLPFRDLRTKASFCKRPQLQQPWRAASPGHEARLAPRPARAANLETYLSFLRGLVAGSAGPDAYGWDRSEYERTGIAQRDKTRTGAGIDIDPLIAQARDQSRSHRGRRRRLRTHR